MSSKRRIADFTKRLKTTVKGVTKRSQMEAIGHEAIRLVVKRTRLGYGAPNGKPGSVERFKLAPLSERYKRFRQTTGADWLSELTTATRSNLTFTGQMLDSMRIKNVRSDGVTFGPSGPRNDPWSKGKTNEEVADYVAKQGRPFNNVTMNEAKQLVRFFRNMFGDLLRNNRLK